MDLSAIRLASAVVASLHLHPEKPGAPMQPVSALEAVADRGIAGNERYFDKRSRTTGEPTNRQVSLMEREQIEAHAQALGLAQIAPGAVRANIETSGLNLIDLIGQHIQVGEAVLFICEARLPCAKMDAVCPGLRMRMQQNRQGVLAKVIRSGHIRMGDAIISAPAENPSGQA
ncbi:MAG: MOSC domain-containing protein [Verrucomicrobiota bacterium]